MKPQDVSDLYLAPVALAVEARIEELGALPPAGLQEQVALVSDSPDFTRELRMDGLVRTVGHPIDLHDWELSWDPRGIRLTHGPHHLVLGVPEALRAFIDGA